MKPFKAAHYFCQYRSSVIVCFYCWVFACTFALADVFVGKKNNEVRKDIEYMAGSQEPTASYYEAKARLMDGGEDVDKILVSYVTPQEHPYVVHTAIGILLKKNKFSDEYLDVVADYTRHVVDKLQNEMSAGEDLSRSEHKIVSTSILVYMKLSGSSKYEDLIAEYLQFTENSTLIGYAIDTLSVVGTKNSISNLNDFINKMSDANPSKDYYRKKVSSALDAIKARVAKDIKMNSAQISPVLSSNMLIEMPKEKLDPVASESAPITQPKPAAKKQPEPAEPKAEEPEPEEDDNPTLYLLIAAVVLGGLFFAIKRKKGTTS